MIDPKKDLTDQTDLKVAECFVEEFEIDKVFEQHSYWSNTDVPPLKKKLHAIINKLRGTLKRDDRKRAILKRNSILNQLETEDPRLFPTAAFDDFMVEHGLADIRMSKADFNSRRSNLRTILCRAVNAKESYGASGIVPFFVDFEGSPNTWRIKTIEDYTRDYMSEYGEKTAATLIGKKLMIEKNLELMEHYSEVPTDIKLQSSLFLEHSLEFSIRVARLQDDMMQKTLTSYTMGVTALEEAADNA